MTDITGSGTFAFQDNNAAAMQWLTFNPSGLRINLKTGEVVIPEGLTLDDASRAFWEGLRQYYGVTPHADIP